MSSLKEKEKWIIYTGFVTDSEFNEKEHDKGYLSKDVDLFLKELKDGAIDGEDIDIGGKGYFYIVNKKEELENIGIKDDFVLVRKDKWKELIK